MDPGDVLRAIRQTQRLSQRELAMHAGLPRSTIDRIESGAIADPKFGTVVAILAATGYQLVVVNQFGRPLRLNVEHDELRDKAWRRLPAHLALFPVRDQGDGWWGWRRIAWWPGEPNVPRYGITRRYPNHWHDPWYADRRWNDAT
jgi:transcriptional regulator with XRE-family HTH domain